jgi:hypothetical protein
MINPEDIKPIVKGCFNCKKFDEETWEVLGGCPVYNYCWFHYQEVIPDFYCENHR